jgi:hypothetical protein
MIPDPLARLLAQRPSFIGVGGFAPDDPLPAALAELTTGAKPVPLEDIDTPQAREGHGPVVVVVRTYSDLYRASQLRGLLPSGRRLVVAVTAMSPLHRPASVHLPPGIPWTSLRELRLLRGPGGLWRVDARLDDHAPIGALLRAVLSASLPKAAPHAPRVGAVDGAALAWAVGTHAVRLDRMAETPAADLVLGTGALPDAAPRAVALPRSGTDPRLADYEAHTDPGSIELPPVNERTVNPLGFLAEASRGRARMSYQGGTWAVHAEGLAPVLLPASGEVTEVEVAALRRLKSVSVDWDSHPGSVAALRAVAALAAAGVPLLSEVPSPLWALPLSRDLRALLDRAHAADLDDPLARELHSIRTRRIALRDHSGHAQRARLGLPHAEPSVSVVLCTRRPQFLAAILGQIDRQHHPDLEVVLTLHGIAADTPGVPEAVAGFGRELTILEVPATTVFGDVLNLGVAAASGEYATKFDDDDWYSPHHVGDLLQASRYANADIVGVQSELIHLEQIGTTVRRRRTSEEYTDHLSGGTLLFKRDFFRSLGGYRPVPTSEDRGLLEDTIDLGGAIYKTHGLGYVLSRHSNGHTWTADTPYFLRGNVMQWHGRNLGPAVAADELETHISTPRKA